MARRPHNKPASPTPVATPALDFGPLPGYFGYHLRMAQLADYADFAREVAPDGVSPGRFSLLTLLAHNPGITQSALSQAVGLDKSTLTPALEQLVRKGVVLRRKAASDRRSYALSLSPKGHALLRRLTAGVERHEANIIALLSPKEQRVFLALLKRLTQGMKARGV
ncbi:MarR family winged helix-turn-helix transcriptional regulator [Ferrovibrio sp.]|uniref:MarR family winged helix-turn-helix transcriptional regulator n=1 Tax=Ferrovibrio sp. TaxID=1917215 RepID=UPI003D28E51C